jgi:hypothetical protein
MKSDELATEVRRVLDEREFLRNTLGIIVSAQNSLNAEILRKLSEARWLRYRHECEKQGWPLWKRLIHRLTRCPICRPEEGKRLDRWE